MNNPLSKMHFDSIFEYSDGDLLYKAGTRKIKPGQKAGHKRPDGYTQVVVDGKKYYAHRIIYSMHYGDITETIDHINGDRSDNRIENLRPATMSQQAMNTRKRENTSGIKGVYFESQTNRWRAAINFNGKSYRSKRFSQLADAERFVINKRKELHGEYSNHGEAL